MQKTILLVDDLPMYIEIQKEFLQNSHADVLTAKDGIEALNVVKERRPDLVFMDLEMPRMDGATCCKAIKSDLGVNDIPVVMVTSSDYEEKCTSAGCDYFLKKPLDRDQFLDIARKVIPEIDRREARLAVRLGCIVHLHNVPITCHLADLSVGGAYVVTDYYGAQGSVIQIKFALPNGRLIDCSGRIAWLNNTGGKQSKGFGIKFSLMPKEAVSALRLFLESDRQIVH